MKGYLAAAAVAVLFIACDGGKEKDIEFEKQMIRAAARNISNYNKKEDVAVSEAASRIIYVFSSGPSSIEHGLPQIEDDYGTPVMLKGLRKDLDILGVPYDPHMFASIQANPALIEYPIYEKFLERVMVRLYEGVQRKIREGKPIEGLQFYGGAPVLQGDTSVWRNPSGTYIQRENTKPWTSYHDEGNLTSSYQGPNISVKKYNLGSEQSAREQKQEQWRQEQFKQAHDGINHAIQESKKKVGNELQGIFGKK